MLMNKLAWEETQGFFRGICYGNGRLVRRNGKRRNRKVIYSAIL